MVSLELPFPPSVNTYWRSPNKGKLAGRHLISERGRRYRKEAVRSIGGQWSGEAIAGRLSVEVHLMVPDRRARDIDNYSKGLLDAITHAGVWVDDEQIDRLTVERGPVTSGGSCQVRIEVIGEAA